MKKKLLGLFMLINISVGAFAQSNGGVEAWDSLYGSKEEPQQWITVNLFSSPLVDASNPRSVYKILSPNQAVGTTSMRIKTVHLNTNPTQGLLPNDCGIAMQGTVSISPGLTLHDRVPYAARPLSFHYVYQYMPVGIDTGFTYVELTKWNTSLGRRDTIATAGFYVHNLINTWTAEVLPLYYYPNHPSTMYPDSLAIVFSSSSYVAPQLNSAMWVDDCYFMGWVGVQEHNGLSSHVSTFPNPAKDDITISADIDNAYAVIVYDGIGQTVGKFEMENKKYVLNVSALRAGNYYFSILDKSGAALTGNTFSVIK